MLATALLALPLLLSIAVQVQTNTDDVNNWIDRTSGQYAEYQEYVSHFGSDDEIIIAWEGCTLDDPRLLIAAEKIREQCGPYVERVVSGVESVQELCNSASQVSETSARKRLRGSLIGEDLSTSCLIVRLNEHARGDLGQALSHLHTTLTDSVGLAPDEIYWGGKAVTDHALNTFTNQSLLWGIPGALLATLLAIGCVRNLRLTLSLIFVATLAALTSLAMVPLSGYRVNGLLVLMPVLVFVLTLGCAVHMVRALQRNLRNRRDDPVSAVQKALQESRPPVLLSMTTTAIGVGSLILSPLSSVFQFGLFSGLSIFFAMLMLLGLLPAIWQQWGTGTSKFRDTPTTQRFIRLLLAINQKPRLVLVLLLALSTPAVYGIQNFRTDFEISNLFAARTDYAKDRQWIETNLFPMGRVDFIVNFPKESGLNRFQQLREVQKIQTSFREYVDYHRALSAANLIKIPRSRSRVQKQIVEQIAANQIDSDYDQLHKMGLLYSTDQDDQWRITVACRIDPERDEATHANNLERLGNTALGDNPEQIQLQSTGMGPLVANGQRQLFLDLTRGLTTAVFLITPLIIVSLQSVKLGLLAMIPNLYPILIVFGCYGLWGRRLDSGSILTASVGLGIAIDDTVHFLHYFKLARREYAKDGRDRESIRIHAVTTAIRRCAWSIATTSIMICSGLCFFVFSDFLPVRNFSLVLIFMMLAAAIADLILLPALIVGLGTSPKKTLNTKTD